MVLTRVMVKGAKEVKKPEDLQLEVGTRRDSRLQVCNIISVCSKHIICQIVQRY